MMQGASTPLPQSCNENPLHITHELSCMSARRQTCAVTTGRVRQDTNAKNSSVPTTQTWTSCAFRRLHHSDLSVRLRAT